MKKDKLYLIISILFVTILVVIVKGFNGTFSAPTGDIGGSGNLYWAIDGENCATSGSSCTLKISNNSIDGTHYVYGKLDGENEYASSAIPWSNYKEGITSIIIGGENDIVSPISTAIWFYDLTEVSKIDFQYFDASNVTNMSGMFWRTGISVTSFSLLNMNNWDTSQVTNMSHMFLGAGSNAKTCNIGVLDNWDTSNVTNMSDMFSGACSKATTWNIGNLSNWDTSQVTSMADMFEYTAFKAKSFDIGNLSNWDTSQVTSMGNMFYEAGKNATTWNVGDLSNWDTSSVTNMSKMFSYAGNSCSTWSVGTLKNWNTSNVTNMSSMFEYAGSYQLKNIELDLSRWNTSQVTSMSRMFYEFGYNATKWSVGDLSGWNTSKVTNMSWMFHGVGYSETNFELNISNWDTSNVTKMDSMFGGICAGSKAQFSLDLSGWDTSKVSVDINLFQGAALSKIIVGDKWTLPLSNRIWVNNDTNEMFENGEIPKNVAATYVLPLLYWAVDGSNCSNTNAKCTLTISNNKINGTHVGSGSFDKTQDMSYGKIPWSSWNYRGIGSVIVGGKDDIIKPLSTAYWFYDLSYVETIDLTYLDTSQVKNMESMFAGFGDHMDNVVLDLSGFDTSNVTNMYRMLQSVGSNAESVSLNLKGWDTSKVTDMSNMFGNCLFDNVIGIEEFDTNNVTDMSFMFSDVIYNSKDYILDLSNWDVSNVTNMSNMFEITIVGYSPNVLDYNVKLNLNNWDVSNVQNTQDIFNLNYYSDIEYPNNYIPYGEIIVGDKWNTQIYDGLWMNKDTKEMYENGNIPANVAATYVKYRINWAIDNNTLILSNNNLDGDIASGAIIDEIGWKEYSSDIKKVKIGGPDDIIKPFNIDNWFNKLYKAEEIDVTYLDTSDIISMKNSFSTGYCYFTDDPSTCISSLKRIIGLENLDTSNVIDMSGIFAYNYILEELDLSGWDTSKVENISNMFLSDTKLERINGLENLDVSNVVEFTNMFSYCSSLNRLDLSNWDTRNGRCYNGLLPIFPILDDSEANNRSECKIFENNTSLNSISIGTNFNIILPDDTWINKETLQSYTNDEIPLNKSATYIKNGIIYWSVIDDTLILTDKDNEGYYSFNTNEYILNQKNWKEYSDNIENVVIDGTIKPYYMNEWFYGLDKVKKLDLSNVDTSKLLSIYKLVNDMDSLEKVDLTSFDLSGINKCIRITKEENKLLPNISTKAEDDEYCENAFGDCEYGYFFYDDKECMIDYYSRCSNDISICEQAKKDCEEGINDASCLTYNDKCIKENIIADYCDTIEGDIYFGIDILVPMYDSNCKNLERSRISCLEAQYTYDEYEDEWEEEFLDNYCSGHSIDNKTCTRALKQCLDGYENDCYAYEEYCQDISYTANQCEEITELISNVPSDEYLEELVYPFLTNKCSENKLSKTSCDNILGSCIMGLNSVSCDFYDDNCMSIGNTGYTCIFAQYTNDKIGGNIYKENLDKYCSNVIISDENCKQFKHECDTTVNLLNAPCDIYENNCKFVDSTCDIFNSNNKLEEISVDENNVSIVKESLNNPNNKENAWYDREGNAYDVSELLDENNTYYYGKPSTVSYNAEVEDQTKYIGEDLTLYDEIIKDSDTSEIITKFDTVGGNDIDDVTSLKITTYTLKDFTDGDGNIYLPGSKYTKDEDLELDVNYNIEDHYNEIELPIPVKHGYKFEYWTLDGERIDEYIPKSNETLVAVWTEIKYNFIDGTDNVNYEEKSEDKVIFITDGIIENFIGLYVNGKRFEFGEDYTLDGNKIVLTEKGKEYLDSLDAGEYEVRAEFSDSNSDVYGIIKVSEKEEQQEEPETPVTPKTGDYILFTIIIALTALISSIFVYKKIEY